MPARRVISKLSGYNFTLVTHRFLLAPHSRSYFALLSHSIERRFLKIKIFSSENLPFFKHLWEVLDWKRFRYTNHFAKLKIFGILILQFDDSETRFDWQPFGRKKDFVLFSKKLFIEKLGSHNWLLHPTYIFDNFWIIRKSHRKLWIIWLSARITRLCHFR